MGTVYVKTAMEMNVQNKVFRKRVEVAHSNILRRMAQSNLKESKKFAETKRFTGELVSSINLSQDGVLKWQVICSAPHAYEIEEGLKTREYRLFSEYPKLEAWVLEKFGYTQGKGIGVGGQNKEGLPSSPNGVPHPKGLHFMQQGFQINVTNSNSIVSQEIMKLNT